MDFFAGEGIFIFQKNLGCVEFPLPPDENFPSKSLIKHKKIKSSEKSGGGIHTP